MSRFGASGLLRFDMIAAAQPKKKKDEGVGYQQQITHRKLENAGQNKNVQLGIYIYICVTMLGGKCSWNHTRAGASLNQSSTANGKLNTVASYRTKDKTSHLSMQGHSIVEKGRGERGTSRETEERRCSVRR